MKKILCVDRTIERAEFARREQPSIITIAITGAVGMQEDYASAFDKIFVKVGDPDEETFNYLNERFKT